MSGVPEGTSASQHDGDDYSESEVDQAIAQITQAMGKKVREETRHLDWRKTAGSKPSERSPSEPRNLDWRKTAGSSSKLGGLPGSSSGSSSPGAGTELPGDGGHDGSSALVGLDVKDAFLAPAFCPKGGNGIDAPPPGGGGHDGLICPVCHKTYSVPMYFRKHMVEKHKMCERTWQTRCRYCGTVFSCYNDFMVHANETKQRYQVCLEKIRRAREMKLPRVSATSDDPLGGDDDDDDDASLQAAAGAAAAAAKRMPAQRCQKRRQKRIRTEVPPIQESKVKEEEPEDVSDNDSDAVDEKVGTTSTTTRSADTTVSGEN